MSFKTTNKVYRNSGYGALKCMMYIWERANRRPGFARIVRRFAVIGGSLGIGTMIIVMSIVEGFHNELKRSFIGFQGNILIYGKNGTKIKNYKNI